VKAALERFCARFGASIAAALLVLTLSAPTMNARAAAATLKPFEASYNWIWHGLNVAESSIQLEHRDDTWTYSTHSEPRGIGRMFSERPTQKSVMRITDAGVEPLSYQAEDGTAATKRDADVHFDWSAGRVSGTYEDAKVDMPLVAGTQDDLSVQIALMVELLEGRTPERFSLLNGNSVREYRYTRESEETLNTALGKIATVVYRSEKENSPRATRVWCAPSLGYIPVRVEQKRKDDVEWSMDIQTLKRP
jgi:hypothetical protein